MSQKEFQRVKVIENAAGGRLSVREASRLLQVSERQVQRLKRRYRPDSIAWVQHGNRGRSTPWALSVPQKQLILNLARGKYQGFNDSHLAEKLRAEENLAVSRETVRRILRAAKLASPQKRRPRQYRSRRPPRPRLGMMALTDASRHDWLQGRGPELTLIGFQDDATSRVPRRSLPTRSRKYSWLSPRSRLHDHHSWRPAQPLPRPPLHLPAQRSPLDPGRTTRRKTVSLLNSDVPSTNSASSRSPPTLPKPKAASNAPGAPARTVWSANCASPAPPPCPKPMPYSTSSVPITTNALLVPPPKPLPTSAPCRAASISIAAWPCTINASWLPTTPSP